MRRSSLLLTALLVLLALPGRTSAQENVAMFPPRLPAELDVQAATFPIDTTRPLQAVEHSDFYYTRLTIHRYGSYAVLPIFAGQYLLGDRLLDGNAPSWVKPAHKATAYTLGALFLSNTVTGVWNAVESRHDKEGRGRRLLHTGLMLAADAGFAYTGIALSDDAAQLGDAGRKHRNGALVSMGLATTGTLLMWLR